MSNANTKFSIIVPIYNVQPFLNQCIDSILGQEYGNFELILVDDGSTDGCPGICDYYASADSRVAVVHKENGGLVSARKAGALRATGDYVCCVDGDDFISEKYTKKFAEAIEAYSSDIVCCNYYTFKKDQKKARVMRFPDGVYDRKRMEREAFPYLLHSQNSQHFPQTIWCKAIKRELYCQIQEKVDPVITTGEDCAVAIPCLYKSSSITIIKDPLYYYRCNSNSITRSASVFQWRRLDALAEQIKNEIPLNEFDFQDQYNRFIAHAFFTNAKSQFNKKEKYSVICNEIKEKTKIAAYSRAIKECRFRGSLKASIMATCLRRGWYFPFWIYNFIRMI